MDVTVTEGFAVTGTYVKITRYFEVCTYVTSHSLCVAQYVLLTPGPWDFWSTEILKPAVRCTFFYKKSKSVGLTYICYKYYLVLIIYGGPEQKQRFTFLLFL